MNMIARRGGSVANSFNRNAGYVTHLVADTAEESTKTPALCGTKPSRGTYGRHRANGNALTCKRCRVVVFRKLRPMMDAFDGSPTT